jgi:hypothetical protein
VVRERVEFAVRVRVRVRVRVTVVRERDEIAATPARVLANQRAASPV